MLTDDLDRFIQPAERQAIYKRASVTYAVQKQIADRWIWERKDIAGWEADLHDVRSMEPETSFGHFFATEDALRSLERDWRRALAQLHASTVRGVTVARIRWSDAAVQRPLVARLRARGTTPGDILAEALAWEVAWQKIEPDWEPITGLTLPGFSAEHAAVRAMERPVAEAEVEWRLAAGRLAVKFATLNDEAQRWYASATAQFYDPESAERNLINSIPTTFVPRYARAAKERRAAKRAAAKAAAAGGAAENVSGAADAASGPV